MWKDLMYVKVKENNYPYNNNQQDALFTFNLFQ